MTLHNLGYAQQARHYLLVHASALEVDAHVGAGGIAQTLGVDIETAAGNHSVVYQMLYALVNGCTRHAALGCHILEGHTGVGG